jgi:hypothetical protein
MAKPKSDSAPLSAGGYVNYKDVFLRKFNGTAKIQSTEKSLAEIIGVPPEAVRLVLPSGRRASRTSNLTRLRKNWHYLPPCNREVKIERLGDRGKIS